MCDTIISIYLSFVKSLACFMLIMKRKPCIYRSGKGRPIFVI
jgi:hypothetical protein